MERGLASTSDVPQDICKLLTTDLWAHHVKMLYRNSSNLLLVYIQDVDNSKVNYIKRTLRVYVQ